MLFFTRGDTDKKNTKNTWVYDMRTNAPWQDRTGNARSGLFSVAEQVSQEMVVIYLSHAHTTDYGIYLELSRGGRFAVITPTMEKLYPEIKRMLDNLLKD